MESEPFVVFLVEDNEDHAELVIRHLADHFVASRVIHVGDGEAAVDYLFRRGAYKDPAGSPRPHVILLDLRLPKMDGVEVLRLLKSDAELSQIPVVVLTTSAADRDIAMAYANHANSYVVKPAGFHQFGDLIENLAFYWLLWNQPSAPGRSEESLPKVM